MAMYHSCCEHFWEATSAVSSLHRRCGWSVKAGYVFFPSHVQSIIFHSFFLLCQLYFAARRESKALLMNCSARSMSGFCRSLPVEILTVPNATSEGIAMARSVSLATGPPL